MQRKALQSSPLSHTLARCDAAVSSLSADARCCTPMHEKHLSLRVRTERPSGESFQSQRALGLFADGSAVRTGGPSSCSSVLLHHFSTEMTHWLFSVVSLFSQLLTMTPPSSDVLPMNASRNKHARVEPLVRALTEQRGTVDAFPSNWFAAKHLQRIIGPQNALRLRPFGLPR